MLGEPLGGGRLVAGTPSILLALQLPVPEGSVEQLGLEDAGEHPRGREGLQERPASRCTGHVSGLSQGWRRTAHRPVRPSACLHVASKLRVVFIFKEL